MQSMQSKQSMHKWVYVFLIVVIVATGLAMVFKVGYDPEPAMVMKPSKFDKVEEIGVVLYRRFYTPIEHRKSIVIGVPPRPDWHREIVTGLMKAAATAGKPFEVVIMDEKMPPLETSGLPPLELHSVPMNTPTLAEWHDRMNQAKSAGKRVLVYTANLYVSHLLEGSPITRFEKVSGERLLSIATAPLALNAGEERFINPPCVGTERDATGTAPLGCAILKAGRGFYRKRIQADRYVAIMNEQGRDDYLLMIAAPGQGQGLAAR